MLPDTSAEHVDRDNRYNDNDDLRGRRFGSLRRRHGDFRSQSRCVGNSSPRRSNQSRELQDVVFGVVPEVMPLWNSLTL
jgi:hypothetical protein